jgi:hypothetical protein
MVDVEAVERMKAAQKAAQETNRIEAAEQLKAIRAQPPRKMPWQQKQSRFCNIFNPFFITCTVFVQGDCFIS